MAILVPSVFLEGGVMTTDYVLPAGARQVSTSALGGMIHSYTDRAEFEAEISTHGGAVKHIRAR